MNTHTIDKVAIGVVALMVAFLSAAIAYDLGQREVRAQAIKRGLASWKVNTKGTEVTFVWNKQ